jgi:arabinose-5-phosphate isomerase
MPNNDYIKAAQRTISLEAQAVDQLQNRLAGAFVAACDLIVACEGRIIVTGMGKSGHIGNKIASTFASTGTPAFFVHPGEASHGDLGMITDIDLVIAISYSGNTSEILTLLPLIKRQNIPLITMTGDTTSVLAKAANVNLDISVEREACPLGLAPTTSSTVTLVMGDALAIALLEARGFTAEDFAFSHPGGALGRKLLLRVNDIMHFEDELPRVLETTPLRDALLEMSAKGFGITTVVNSTNELVGVFTDGDLRRAIDNKVDINNAHTGAVMTQGCKTVHQEMLAAEAVKIMEDSKITAVIVADDNQHPLGVLRMHDILRAGVV